MKLKVENLEVTLGKNKILKGVSLDVTKGEFIALLGSSGCGKSTLLKTISGINYAEAGTISLDDEVINDIPAHKRGTVIVFQDIRLFPHMNVIDNVAYSLKVKKVPKDERYRMAKESLADVHLEGYENRRINQLSGGQQQRVALARALAAKPSLLLLDEPFSALDENLRESMRKLVKELHHEYDMTTVMVTHDRKEALEMTDRIAVMFDGQIIQYASPKDILENPVDERIRDYFRDISI